MQVVEAILSFLCDPDWLSPVSPEISQWYGENPYVFEAQSRILTQRFAQRTRPMDKPYTQVYFETLRQLGIRQPDVNYQLEDVATQHLEVARRRPNNGPNVDDHETYMPLFVVCISWFVLCLAVHFLFVEPSFI